MPLIIVPATISELENWLSLAQFMAQWFHVYFFELPGHGRSEPFRNRSPASASLNLSHSWPMPWDSNAST